MASAISSAFVGKDLEVDPCFMSRSPSKRNHAKTIPALGVGHVDDAPSEPADEVHAKLTVILTRVLLSHHGSVEYSFAALEVEAMPSQVLLPLGLVPSDHKLIVATKKTAVNGQGKQGPGGGAPSPGREARVGRERGSGGEGRQRRVPVEAYSSRSFFVRFSFSAKRSAIS